MMPDAVVVLFSGGSDSTMAAVVGAQRFRRVFLVTYLHRLMFFHHKILINVGRLSEAFPDTEFITHETTFTRLFAKLYLRSFSRRLLRYGTMVVPWICASCKLAMHLKTIDFCRVHGVTHVYCGANDESSHVFPAQMEPVITETKKLYGACGITYETPVYHMERTDRRLKEMGVVDDGMMKDQRLIYTTQHTCPLGVILHAHSRLYYTRLHGLGKYQRLAYEMAREVIAELMPDLEEKRP